MSLQRAFIQSRSMGSWFDEDYEGDESTPEKRLWVAVILASVQEYEEQLQVIHKMWSADHKPIAKQFQNQLKMLKYEMSHEWFRHVCEMADWDFYSIRGKLNALEEKYRLDEVEFTTEDSVILRFQIKKLRNRVVRYL